MNILETLLTFNPFKNYHCEFPLNIARTDILWYWCSSCLSYSNNFCRTAQWFCCAKIDISRATKAIWPKLSCNILWHLVLPIGVKVYVFSVKHVFLTECNIAKYCKLSLYYTLLGHSWVWHWICCADWGCIATSVWICTTNSVSSEALSAYVSLCQKLWIIIREDQLLLAKKIRCSDNRYSQGSKPGKLLRFDFCYIPLWESYVCFRWKLYYICNRKIHVGHAKSW